MVNLSHAEDYRLIELVIFTSVIVFQAAYIILQWYYVKRFEYLYYVAFMLGGLMYGLEEIESAMPFKFFTLFDTHFHNHVQHALPIFCVYLYYCFASSFLDIKHTHAALNMWVVRLRKFLVCYCIFELAFKVAGFDAMLSEYIFRSVSAIIFSASVIFIFVVLKNSNTLIRFTITGAVLLMAGSLCTLILLIMEMNGNVFSFDPFLPMLAGFIAELLTFSTGLTYKSLMIEKEKVIIQQQFIEKMKENELLNSKMHSIRTKIAGDMHDDLGAGLSKIVLLGEVLKKEAGDDESRSHAEKISYSATTALEHMSELVWSLNEKNDMLPNMVAYIRKYAAEYFDCTSVDCKIIIADDIPQVSISGEQRRNIFLCVKEALHNVMKHSGATTILITFNHEHTVFEISIHDNGKGMMTDAANQWGNGLKNMNRRMAEAGGTVEVENNNGTVVRMIVPLNALTPTGY